MSDNKEYLQYFIDLKKTKKEPNSFERSEFTAAWENLVREEGYSEAADYFLFNGFVYCGAVPLKNYIKSANIPMDALKKVFAGKMYGKDTAKTVSVLFHLFTLFVNEKKQNLEIIADLIRHIPHALKNKEGNIYGQADRALKKYVLDELRTEHMPDFGAMIDGGLDIRVIRYFINNIDEIFQKMNSEGYSKRCLKNIGIIKEWMHPSVDSPEDVVEIKQNDHVSENEKQCSITVDREAFKEDPKEDSEEVSKENPKEDSEEVSKENPKEDLTVIVIDKNVQADVSVNTEADEKQTEINVLAEQEKVIEELRKEKAEQENRINTLNTEMLQLQHELNDMSRVNSLLKEKISEKESQLSALSSTNLENRRNIELLNTELGAKEQKIEEQRIEISQMIQMNEALRRDRVKQKDEAINRLASKLRVEYRDFVDAIDLPMDSDLGENMREQLKNVFDILIKAGISLK